MTIYVLKNRMKVLGGNGMITGFETYTFDCYKDKAKADKEAERWNDAYAHFSHHECAGSVYVEKQEITQSRYDNYLQMRSEIENGRMPEYLK